MAQCQDKTLVCANGNPPVCLPGDASCSRCVCGLAPLVYNKPYSWHLTYGGYLKLTVGPTDLTLIWSLGDAPPGWLSMSKADASLTITPGDSPPSSCFIMFTSQTKGPNEVVMNHDELSIVMGTSIDNDNGNVLGMCCQGMYLQNATFQFMPMSLCAGSTPALFTIISTEPSLLNITQNSTFTLSYNVASCGSAGNSLVSAFTTLGDVTKNVLGTIPSTAVYNGEQTPAIFLVHSVSGGDDYVPALTRCTATSCPKNQQCNANGLCQSPSCISNSDCGDPLLQCKDHQCQPYTCSVPDDCVTLLGPQYTCGPNSTCILAPIVPSAWDKYKKYVPLVIMAVLVATYLWYKQNKKQKGGQQNTLQQILQSK